MTAPATITRHAARRPFRPGDRIRIIREGRCREAIVVTSGSGLGVRLADTHERASLPASEIITRVAS